MLAARQLPWAVVPPASLVFSEQGGNGFDGKSKSKMTVQLCLPPEPSHSPLFASHAMTGLPDIYVMNSVLRSAGNDLGVAHLSMHSFTRFIHSLIHG